MLQLKGIIDGEDYDDEIEKIDASTRRGMKIKNFYGDNSDEMKYDKDFELNCITLAPYMNEPIKSITTKQYFTLLKFVDDKNRKQKK